MRDPWTDLMLCFICIWFITFLISIGYALTPAPYPPPWRDRTDTPTSLRPTLSPTITITHVPSPAPT